MAATPEAKVKKKVKEILDRSGRVYHCMPPANGFGRTGIPDILCCISGRFLAIECKANGNTPTVRQQTELDGIEAAGGVALVINETNLDLLERVVQTMLNLGPLTYRGNDAQAW